MSLTFLLTILMSVVAGGIIGVERQWRQKLAGMRTTVLVSLGACMFVQLSTLTQGDDSPTRIAAQVVSGIGFLAGGIILRDGMNVRGLNTAATLWCAAAVGSMIGSSFIIEGMVCALVITIVNIIVRTFSDTVDKMYEKVQEIKHESPLLYISIETQEENEEKIYNCIWQLLSEQSLPLEQLSTTQLKNKNIQIIAIMEAHVVEVDEIIEKLKELPEVLKINQMFVENDYKN